MIKRLLFLILLSLCLVTPGFAADGDRVIQGLDITGSIVWGTGGTFENPYQQTVSVAKSGADYTTIQGAIDSITDNSTSKRYVVLIHPGTYTEDIVM